MRRNYFCFINNSLDKGSAKPLNIRVDMEPATKEDLRELKTDLVKLMDVKFEAVSAKFETVSAKFETVATKEELVILESRMFKWGLSLVISNVSIAIAISFAAQKLLG